MKVCDCFTFYNEFELLELRLKNLWDVADYFLLVEADKKHTNEPKPYYFWERKDEFKNFWPKIKYLPVEMKMPFRGVGDWSIENAQREAIAYALEDAAPDDLIMISDLDEIPAPDVVKKIRDGQLADVLEKTPMVMEQKLLYYFFDCANDGFWYGTILTKRKNLTTPQKLRNLRNNLPRIADGGWHFSTMGGVDRVINKMNSIVEGPVFVKHFGEKILDKKHIEKSLANGTDIYNRQGYPPCQFYDAKKIRLPHLHEFLKKYPHFLREPEKYFGD